MIATYSEYIDEFITRPVKEGRPIPGEHHFVSAYLLPRIYDIRGAVPEYINPDGTKAVIGDVVYYDNGSHQHGIEVKLGSIRLTSGEYNRWIVRRNRSARPDTFVGMGAKGVVVCDWQKFRSAYIRLVQTREGGTWTPTELSKAKQYGPIRQVDALRPFVSGGNELEYKSELEAAAEAEASFVTALWFAIER